MPTHPESSFDTLNAQALWRRMGDALPPAAWDPLHQAAHRFAAEERWSLQVGQWVGDMDTLEGRLSVELGWAVGALLTEIAEGLELEQPRALSRGQTGLVNALVPLVAIVDEDCEGPAKASLESDGPFVAVLLGGEPLVHLCVAGEPEQRQRLTEALQLALRFVRTAAETFHKILTWGELVTLQEAIAQGVAEPEPDATAATAAGA